MRLLALICTLAFAAASGAQEGDPFRIAGQASAAYEAGRYEEAATLYRTVTEMLPRSVSARVQRARALARMGKTDEALSQLRVAAGYGGRFDAEDAAWGGMRGQAPFTALVAEMRSRTAPLLRSETAFLLEKDLIPENVAWDPKTGSFYVGSMYKAKIVRVTADGKLSDFIPSRRDGLLSVLGMKIDAARRELWAVAGNFIDSPPMQDDDAASRGKGGIWRYDLDSGRLIARTMMPGGTPDDPRWLNDLVLAPDGAVYATAGPGGIWRLSPDGQLQPFHAPGGFLNGIAITPDGKYLFAASHLTGVIRVDVKTKEQRLIGMPPGVTLAGIDGLYFHEGSLVGVQNGVNPSRVIRAWLDPELTRVIEFRVLEQDHPQADVPLTGVIAGNHLYYVARSQIRAFEGMKIWPMDRLKETVILKLPLDPPAPPPPDLAAERASLLAMHRGEIRAHIDRDAEWIGRTTGEEFISASGGRIDRAGAENVRQFFTGYFEGATYPQYEDLEPPVIRVSDDGSMAWIMSRLRVRRAHAGQERSFVYAGVMMYEKRDGAWVRVANASTFE